MTGDHLDARLDAMSQRQDRQERRLDEIDRITTATAHKLDLALSDVALMRGSLSEMSADVREIKTLIADAHLLARFTRKTFTVVAVIASTLYGVTSWAEVKAAVNAWLGR